MNRSDSAEAGPVEQAFAANYPAFQYAFVQFLSEHLADCSRAFGGDLQQLLILAVVGQVALAARLRGQEPCEAPGISASRLADVCGIPRETVRRKLKLLERRNWIQKIDSQSWTVVGAGGETPARDELTALERRAVERIAKFYAALERLAAPPAPKPARLARRIGAEIGLDA